MLVDRSIMLASESGAAGRSRRFVRDVLAASGAAHLCDSAALLVSELVTNAVLHAGRGPIQVQVSADESGCRVEVSDTSSQPPRHRHHADLSSTGRGLRLVDEVASDWGVAALTGGKIVWFELGAPFPGPGTTRSSSHHDVGAARR